MTTASTEAAATFAVGVLGTGSYLPDRVVGNDEVGAPAGVDDEWIRRKTGVAERRAAWPEEAASDLAVAAARRALDAAGTRARDLDLIVVATSTGDSPQPPTACLVQRALGARDAAAFDLNAVCSGFVFGLSVAERMLASAGTALVVGVDVYSRILDPTDQRTVVLFGDGAGAAVLGSVRPGRGVLASRLTSFGSHHELISVPAGGSRMPPSERTLAERAHYFRMDGRKVREFVAGNVPRLVREFLHESGVDPASVAHFVPHQANGVMLDDLANRLGLRGAAVHTTVERFGNTGSASVGVTLDSAVRAGRIRSGDLVLLAGFGGGMAVGMALLRWP